MGCDIHIHCEYRSKETDFKWFNCDWYRRNPYYKKFEPENVEPKWSLLPAYDGRSYSLFGILAGVRDNSYDAIDDPRGIPSDMSKQTRKEYRDEMEWCHSFSWLSLEELIKYRDNHLHDNYDDFDGINSLSNLIQCLFTRFDNVFHVYDFFSDAEKDQKRREYAKDARIVFWFDS